MHDQEVTCRRVSLQPLGLLSESLALMGNQYWLFVGITFVGILIASLVPMGILLGPMMCGIFLCFLERTRGRQVTFEMLFKGFDYFAESLIAAIIIFVATIVILIPAYLILGATIIGAAAAGGAAGGDAGAVSAVFVMFGGLLVILALTFLIGVPFVFVFPLIVGHKMQAIPAIKASWKGAMSNLGGVVALVVVYSILNVLGSLCCYVPAVLLAPLMLGGIFLAYQKVYEAAPAQEKPPQAAEGW